MNSITKILLISLVIILAGTTAIFYNNSVNHKNEKEELIDKLEKANIAYDKLHLENKKLSKRVINEINRIIVLSDSVKTLDETIQEDKLKLSLKPLIDDLKNESQKTSITSSSNATPLYASIMETTPMQKNTEGVYIRTSDYNKIDGFKTKFELLNNHIAENSDEKKVVVSYTYTKDRSISFSKELQIKPDKKSLEVITTVEVDRKYIISGVYEVAISVDGEKIRSTNIIINII